MNKEPIIIVAGEPNSVFLETFFKSLKIKIFKSPLILIVSKKLLKQQMKKLGFDYKINTIDVNFKKYNELDNININLIDIKYEFNKCFDKISDKSNNYIEKSFKVALDLLTKNNFSKLINGPISKKHFLKGKSLGITEYLANKTKKKKQYCYVNIQQKIIC